MIKIVNSKESAVECYQIIKDMFQKHKYLRVKIQEGSRTLDQNHWIYQAYSMIATQTGDTPTQVRRYCKLTFGLVILFSDDEEAAKRWRTMLRSITHEEKLEAMDQVDVTSSFTVKEGSTYIKSIIDNYQGLDLPENIK